MKSPKTVADFAALILDSRKKGEAPVSADFVVFVHEEGKKGHRIVGVRVDGSRRWVSSWQDSEERAVHDAIARAFC